MGLRKIFKIVDVFIPPSRHTLFLLESFLSKTELCQLRVRFKLDTCYWRRWKKYFLCEFICDGCARCRKKLNQFSLAKLQSSYIEDILLFNKGEKICRSKSNFNNKVHVSTYVLQIWRTFSNYVCFFINCSFTCSYRNN